MSSYLADIIGKRDYHLAPHFRTARQKPGVSAPFHRRQSPKCGSWGKEIGIERSIHAGWQNYSEKFRLIMRLDGAPKDSVAVTPISGSDSFSWAVAIGAR